MSGSLLRLVVRQLKTTYDLKPALLVSLVLPSFLYVLVAGVAYSAIIPPFILAGRTISYAAFLVPGVVLMEVANLSILGGAMFWTDKYNGMLDRLMTMPFPRWYYFASRTLALLVASAAVAAALILAGIPFMLPLVKMNLAGGFLCVVTIVLVCLLFSSLSLLISPYLPTPDSLTVFSRLVSTPLVLMSSVFYPLDRTPQVIQSIAKYNPLSFAADVFRSSLYGLPTDSLGAELSALLTVALSVAAVTICVFSRKDITLG